MSKDRLDFKVAAHVLEIIQGEMDTECAIVIAICPVRDNEASGKPTMVTNLYLDYAKKFIEFVAQDMNSPDSLTKYGTHKYN
jgi:hypothetical protein